MTIAKLKEKLISWIPSARMPDSDRNKPKRLSLGALQFQITGKGQMLLPGIAEPYRWQDSVLKRPSS
jgi:hypothetical protein